MILGADDINIAGMQLDRVEPGGKALMVLTVDSPVSVEVMEKISKVANITNATHVEF